MKIYISGKVTGLNPQDVKKRFEDAESLLEEIGFDVVNPLNNGLNENAAWKQHMVRDIELLMDCDAIYMMDGWIDSTGAQIEYDIATRMKLVILFETKIIRENQRIQKIKNAIHAVTGLHYDQYVAKNNSTMMSYARMLFVHHCYKCRFTLKMIGNFLHRKHSSILYLLNRYDNDRQYNPRFEAMAQRTEDLIGVFKEPKTERRKFKLHRKHKYNNKNNGKKQ